MIVEGYSLHVYCRNSGTSLPLGAKSQCRAPFKEESREFGGVNKRDAYKQARAVGWKFIGSDVECPWCQDAEGVDHE